MKIKLPEKICILDIETEKKNPEKTKLFFVGVKIYNLHKKRYFPCKHKCFFPDQTSELRKFLKEFQGIIIGHNIFDFDYRVLDSLITLTGVIEKTVDTYAFIFNKNPFEPAGTNLNDLSRANFRKEKTLKGKNISKLWREGKHKEVIKYNENDLKLTKYLWWHLINKRFCKVMYYDEYDNGELKNFFKISEKDILQLIGKRPFFDYQTWKLKIKKDGKILVIREQWLYKDDNWKDILRIMPFKKCPECGSKDTLAEVEFDNLSEGQLGDYLAGFGKVYYCLKCSNLINYEGNLSDLPITLDFSYKKHFIKVKYSNDE